MKRKLEAARRLLQRAGFTRSFARMVALDCRDSGPMIYYWLDYGHSAQPARPDLAAQIRKIFAAVQMVTVDVTQEDIDNGAWRDRHSCPIACALRRVTGEHWRVSKIDGAVCVDRQFQTPLPETALQFITVYDEWGTKDQAKPFSFELDFAWFWFSAEVK
jgi:hypothetical protein